MDLDAPRDAAGLLTRARLLQQGRTAQELRLAVRAGGPLVVVRRGVYVPRERWEAADATERLRLADRAVHLGLRRAHHLSHDSAARAWDLWQLRPDLELTHVTRSGLRGARTEHGVRHHLAHGELQPAERDGLPVTGLARTALDVARERGPLHGAVTTTAVLRRGVPRTELAAVARSMWCWPGSTGVRRAIDWADPGCESPGEVLARELVLGLGLGVPVTQVAVRLADGALAWCDLLLGSHVVEFDGKVKYQRVEDGGVADRPASEVAWDERRRERALLGLGLGVSRLVWADLFGAARVAAQDRLRVEVRATHALRGVVAPPWLEELNARLRPARVPWAYTELPSVLVASPGVDT